MARTVAGDASRTVVDAAGADRRITKTDGASDQADGGGAEAGGPIGGTKLSDAWPGAIAVDATNIYWLNILDGGYATSRCLPPRPSIAQTRCPCTRERTFDTPGFLEPSLQTLSTYALEGQRWVLLEPFRGDRGVRAVPFDAIELELGALEWIQVEPWS